MLITCADNGVEYTDEVFLGLRHILALIINLIQYTGWTENPAWGPGPGLLQVKGLYNAGPALGLELERVKLYRTRVGLGLWVADLA